jgi:hypothetical protein
LDRKKQNKIIIDNFELFNKSDSSSYSDNTIEKQLNYIFEPINKNKKEYKLSKLGSCKCTKTGCSKYSCNCLKNGLNCDFLCSCVNCRNSKNSNSSFLNKKILRNE